MTHLVFDPTPPLLIDGDLSIFSAQHWHARLSAQLNDNNQIEIDLSRVTDIDSAGLQLLLATLRHALLAEKTVLFTNPSAVVCEIICFCGMTDLFGPAMPALQETAQ